MKDNIFAVWNSKVGTKRTWESSRAHREWLRMSYFKEKEQNQESSWSSMGPCLRSYCTVLFNRIKRQLASTGHSLRLHFNTQAQRLGEGVHYSHFPRAFFGFYEMVPSHPAARMPLVSRAFRFSSGCFDLHQLCLFFCKVATAKSHLEGKETEAQKMKWTLQS